VAQQSAKFGVPSPNEAANTSWWTFKHFNSASAQDPRLCYLSGYHRAVKDMLADQFDFGGYAPLTRRMLEVMEALLIERDALRMVADEMQLPLPEGAA